APFATAVIVVKLSIDGFGFPVGARLNCEFVGEIANERRIDQRRRRAQTNAVSATYDSKSNAEKSPRGAADGSLSLRPRKYLRHISPRPSRPLRVGRFRISLCRGNGGRGGRTHQRA